MRSAYQGRPRWRVVFSCAILLGVGCALGIARAGEAERPDGLVVATFPARVSGIRDMKFYLRPVGGVLDRKPKGVLAICAVGERVEIPTYLSASSPDFGYLVDFADRNDLAMMAFGQPTKGGAWDRRVSGDEMEADIARDFDKNFEAVAREWARAATKFAADNRLPTTGWFLYGMCGGAQYAHRLALREPRMFKAVHAHFGGSYDVPTRGGNSVLWLITTFEDDVGHVPSQRFYRSCLDLGYRIMIRSVPRRADPGEQRVRKLSLLFFEYALGVKGPADVKAEYIGDYVNNVAFPAAKASWIPKEQSVVLPTRAMAEAWGEIQE
ncbi:MAG TPA: hypothetical protein PLU30_09325 [Verrucomicrobiae bacterium]|nr:hypothetical protein [Verrucomicrobiae bacterium]